MLNLKPAVIFTICLCLALSLNACSLMEIKEQSERIENHAQISGIVDVDEANTHPVFVRLYKSPTTVGDLIQEIRQIKVDSNYNYHFYIDPGEYLVGAYVDVNSNRDFERNSEEAAMYIEEGDKRFTVITVTENEKKEIKPLVINSLVNEQLYSDIEVRDAYSNIEKNVGKEVAINDVMFSEENAKLGLLYPFDFIEQVSGGLLILQPFESNKVPVLFIHGISGNPREFETVIETLDRERFQPWVLYYPSGVALDIVSGYLLDGLNTLQVKYGFSDIYLIAHSMGGLMSRSFLMNHQASNPKFDISLYVTINSPLYGMDSAATGVATSPIVIASWRDIATGSEYIERVHAWRIPETIPYHLIYSKLPKEDGDGVVPVNSQVSPSLREEATLGTRRFKAQHAGVLKDEGFVKHLNQILANQKQ